MYKLYRRIKTLFGRRRQERDLQDELAAHLAMDVEERIEAGERPDAARQAARRDFGSLLRTAEDTRDVWGWTGLEQCAQDLRYAVRGVFRNPGFALSALLTLGLAIGGTTAVFSVVYFALLRPLPFRAPDRIVRLFEPGGFPISPPNFLDWKAQNRVFQRIAAFRPAPGRIETPDGVEQIGGMQVSADFFTLLGVEPLYGRGFLAEDDRSEAERVVILSHEAWRARFGGDPGIIGRPLALGPESFTVIGILPPDFRFSARKIDLWTPLRLGDASHRMQRTERYLQAVGRLRDGVSLSQAKTEMDALAARIALENTGTNENAGVDIVSLQENLVGNLRTPLFVLLSASGFVLMIGCLNLTNLLLARLLARYRELTIRSALGAGRLRILRQLIAEGILIGLIGGVAGTMIAIAGIKAALPILSRIGGPYAFLVSRMTDLAVDWRVFVFGLTMSLAAACFAAVVAAIHATGPNLYEALQQGGRGALEARPRARLRSALVVAEISLTFILLVGAGLLLHSFWRLLQVDLGFEPERIVTMRLYSSPPEAIHFYQNVLERVRTADGVESASVVSSLPLLGVDTATVFSIENRPPVPVPQWPQVVYKVVGDRYFETMGIPLVEGRSFDRQDVEGREPVVIVNEALARKYWPGESPVGRRIQRGGPKRRWDRIVGVVKDVKVSGPDTETPPEVYIPHSQFPLPNMTLAVRTTSEPARAIAPLRAQIRSLDDRALITNIEAMKDALSRVVAPRELNTMLLSIFALVALCLATVGVYGLVSYSVARRTPEIGIRVALGAGRREVVLFVLRQGMMPALAGVVIGLAGAVSLTRWMTALLFEVDPTDPWTLVAMTLVLLTAAFVGCYLPARRAAEMDPLAALREE